MRYEIVMTPGAARAFRALSARRHAELRDAIEVHLRYEPTKVSKSRIRRLRGVTRPQYRLRVGDVRVFYDVSAMEVQVLAIVTKAEAQAWIERKGAADESGGAGEGQG